MGFLSLVIGVVGVSTLAGLLFIGFDSRYKRFTHQIIPILLVVLGGLTMLLASSRSLRVATIGASLGIAIILLRNKSRAESKATAETTTWVVVVHRAIEGCIIATVYTADAALAVLSAVILTAHAAVETAVVGSLYSRVASFSAAGLAVLTVQAGFVAGALLGSEFVSSVPETSQTLILGIVGSVFLAVGILEIDYWPESLAVVDRRL